MAQNRIWIQLTLADIEHFARLKDMFSISIKWGAIETEDAHRLLTDLSWVQARILAFDQNRPNSSLKPDPIVSTKEPQQP